MNKNFWMEALKGGTIIGLVSVGFSILSNSMGEDSGAMIKIVSFLSTFILIFLAFAFTRKFAAGHTLEQGFSFGRGVGFVVVMMLFVGILQGVYSSIMAKFFIGDELMKAVDEVMVQMQDKLPAEQFDQTYQMMRKSMTSPLLLTLSSVLSNVFYGLFVGVCVSLFTRRRPDIFADSNNQPQQ
jgi:hypothetical protein